VGHSNLWLVTRSVACVGVQSEIASLKADNERLQTVVAERTGIDGSELLKQTSLQSTSTADATSGYYYYYYYYYYYSEISQLLADVFVVSRLEPFTQCDPS